MPSPRLVFTGFAGGADAGFTPPDGVTIHDSFDPPMFPPLSWFDYPGDILIRGQKLLPVLDGPDRGRVAGYIAPKNECLLDGSRECWTVPESPSNYVFALSGNTVTASGVIRTANIGGGAGHAKKVRLPLAEVIDFYERTSTQIASVVYGADDYGVWAAGALVPSATWGQVLEAMRSAVSGDWRLEDETDLYEFCGSCLVSIPGFPMTPQARILAAASAAPDRSVITTVFGGTTMTTQPRVLSGEVAPHACSCQPNPLAQTASVEAPEAVAYTQEQLDELVTAAVQRGRDEAVAALQPQIDEAKAMLADHAGAIAGLMDPPRT